MQTGAEPRPDRAAALACAALHAVPARRPDTVPARLPALPRSCPSGHYTGVETGASSCTPCEPGKFAGLPNTVTCDACAAGTFAAEEGQKACKPCAAGQVSATTSTLAANADGSFGNATVSGSTQCVACPRRTFRPSIFAANLCTLCPTGRETRAASGASTCTACIPGTSLLTTTNALDVNCTACPPGERPATQGLRLGPVARAGCAAALLTARSLPPADSAPPATLLPSRPLLLSPPRTCHLTTAGRFAEDQGMSDVCPQCPAGSSVSDSGNQVCDVCAPGTYQNTPGSLACIPW